MFSGQIFTGNCVPVTHVYLLALLTVSRGKNVPVSRALFFTSIYFVTWGLTYKHDSKSQAFKIYVFYRQTPNNILARQVDIVYVRVVHVC